jgi:muramidase (phage lysozyme)
MATPLLPPSTQSGKLVGKKISTQSLFGKSKKSGALVKVGKSSIQLRPKSISTIIKSPTEVSEQIGGQEDGDINVQNLKKKFVGINEKLNNLVQFFIDRKKEKSKTINEERKKEEKEKKEKEEEKLEKPKVPKVQGVKTPTLPKFNFLDNVFNFFGSILLGSLLNFLLSKKNFIFAALDDILDGFNNVFNLIKFSVISLTNTSKGLIKTVAKLGTKLFKGPAQLTGNLLSKLGKSVKNLLLKTGKALSGFVKGTFKNISGLATGAASTRATGVAKRGLGAVTRRGLPRTIKRTAAAVGGRPAASLVKRAEKLFGEKGAKHLGKVSGIFKKIPFIGALIGIGIDLAMGERLDNAVAGAVGASLGAAIGGAIGTVALPIPGVGTFLGGVIGAAIGDWAGKEIYRNISGKVSQINPKPEDLGAPTPEPPAGPSAGGGGAITSAAIPAEGKALLDAIAGAEGDYNSRYPSKTFSGYADHPRIDEPTPDGRTSNAAGRYQFLSTTWDKYKPAKAFTPENQDIAAWRLATAVYGYGERGLVNALKKDPMQVAAKLRGTWPSLPGGSQQNVHTSGYLSRYQNALKKYQGLTAGPSQNVGVQYQTNTYRNQYYGAPRPGRKHAGVDIQMYSGSKQITFLGGRVVNIGNEPGGYYTYIDILTPTGKIERLAELGRLDPAVKRGAILAPGQVVSHGVGPTGVTHLEYRNPGTSGFSGTVNPLEYLRSIGSIFGGNTFQYKGGPGGAIPSNQIAQVPTQPTQSLNQKAKQIMQQASYEGQQQVVPIPIPMGGGAIPPMVSGGGGGGVIPVGLSKREALNSYYQSQLIGFLYKQV